MNSARAMAVFMVALKASGLLLALLAMGRGVYEAGRLIVS